MKNLKSIIALMLVLILCVGLFAACGNKEETSPTPDATTPDDSSPAVGGKTGGDLDYILSKGKMVIGYTDYAPMNYTDDNGEFTGFDTEFAIAVCEKLGVEPDFIEINWDTKEIELNAKSLDCIWNGLTIDPVRAENMSITVPYVKNAQVVVVKADSGITSTKDLVGKTVVAEIGSAGETMIIGSEDADPEEFLAQATYVGVNKQTDCLVEVLAGTADAGVLDWTLAKTMVGEGTDFVALMMVPDLFLGDEEYGVAFRKGSDVTEKVNAIIMELVADGTLPALAEKYGLSLSPAIAG